jgi:hypothetical protein
MKGPFLFLALLFSCTSARADLPLNGVNLSVKPLSIQESRTTTWSTDYGSYEKFATKSIAVAIEVRRTVRGDPTVSIEWYFLARDAANRQPFVFDAARTEMILSEAVTRKFTVTSGAVSDSDAKYSALGQRYRDGEKLWGWLVLVRSGRSVIAAEASLPEIREWLMKRLSDGIVDRAPPAAKNKNG